MDRLKTFDWDGHLENVGNWSTAIAVARLLGTGLLWMIARPTLMLILRVVAGALLYRV